MTDSSFLVSAHVSVHTSVCCVTFTPTALPFVDLFETPL